MSGQLRLARADEPRAPHTHVVFSLSDGRELRFVDPRRFGLVCAAFEPEDLPIPDLGPDPLSSDPVRGLDAARFALALGSSRAPIKSFLLDQRKVAGLGNIYVCEALFRARIHPNSPARRTRHRAAALCTAIRETLDLGIANRGTTLRDYVDSDGRTGSNLQALLVYGREGQPCSACASPIRRRVMAQRGTFYCPRCQF
jgi:formamidopyrimidine-DNA glycosylase